MTKAFLNLFAVIFMTLALPLAAGAKEWRGVVPLRSTLADVVRLLGAGASGADRYEFDREEVEIFYSSRLPCSAGAEWKVTSDTVTGIWVYPRPAPKLSDLRLDLSQYEKRERMGDVDYTNGREGVSYVVRGNGTLRGIHYRPTAEDDARFRCPNPIQETCIHPTDPCPSASITASPETPAGTTHQLHISIAGADPEDTFTFLWSVSAGEITSGQGTGAITVDAAAAGGQKVVVRVSVRSRTCEFCGMIASCVLEPSPGRGTGGGRRRLRPPREP
jgi:hypothetical protein